MVGRGVSSVQDRLAPDERSPRGRSFRAPLADLTVCSDTPVGGRRWPAQLSKPTRKCRSLAERFWAKVHKTDGCWLWLGSLNGFGYGQIRGEWPGPRALRSHRASWILHCGPIPAGLSVLHRCDNPPCVRPDHLFLGTQSDNQRDMTTKGRHFRGERASALRLAIGINRGERNVFAKLTEEQVKEIRAMHAAGVEQATIAAEFNVHAKTIGSVVTRATWRHVA